MTIKGASGALNATASLALSLDTTPVARPFTTVGGGLVRGFYDETRALLFTTNPLLNEVDVLSGQNLAVMARVSVPQPLGIDQMADGNTLVVGTLTQAIYTINENTLAVTQHLAPNFTTTGGPAGLSTTVLNVPVAMANGKVLILGQDIGIYLDYIYGGQYIIEWDSNTGVFSLVMYSPSDVFNLKRSADHQWAIFGGEISQLYLYNSDTDSFTSSNAPVAAASYGCETSLPTLTEHNLQLHPHIQFRFTIRPLMHWVRLTWALQEVLFFRTPTCSTALMTASCIGSFTGTPVAAR